MIRRIVLVFALALATQSGHAGDSPITAVGLWSCMSDVNQPTVYFARVFKMQSRDGVDIAFEQAIEQQYGTKVTTSCPMSYDASQAVVEKLQTDQQRYAQQLRNMGKHVVETGWVFDAGKAALPFVCDAAFEIAATNGQRTYRHQITPVMHVAGAPTAIEITQAWRAHMKASYPSVTLFNPSRCSLLPNDEAKAAKMRQGLLDTYKNQVTVSGGTMAVIDDPWTYTGGTAIAAATPAPVVATPPPVAIPAKPAAAPVVAQPPPPAPVASAPAVVPVKPAAPPPPKPIAYVCQTRHFTPPPDRHYTVYKSPPFTPTGDVSHLSQAWRSYLASHYHLTGQLAGSCMEASPSTEAILSAYKQQLAGQRIDVVDVNWNGAP